MAVDGIDGRRRGKRRKEMSPGVRVSTRLSLGVKNERTDAGRDGRTCLARPNSQAQTGIATGMIGNHTG